MNKGFSKNISPSEIQNNRIIKAVSLLFFLLLMVSESSGFDQNVLKTASPSMKNAVWIKESSIKENIFEIRTIGKELEKAGLLRIFLRTGWINEDGTINKIEIQKLKTFSDLLRNWNDEFQVIPWIGFNTKKADYHNEKVRTNFIRDLKGIMRFTDVLDLHLDIEPVKADQNFFRFVKTIKKSLPGIRLSFASPKPLLNEYGVNSLVKSQFWRLEDLGELCGIMDEVVVMFYDTGFYRISDYKEYLKKSILALLVTAAEKGCKITAGIPDYYEPSIRHNPVVENIKNALESLRDVIAEPSFILPKFGGISVYNFENLDNDEIKDISIFEKIFNDGEGALQ